MKKSFADILDSLEVESARKAARKMPAWSVASRRRMAQGLEPLEIPTALSLEQCSSEETARYKCRLLSGLFPEGAGLLCDLTCGLGIDTLAFCCFARKVISFERSQELAAAARRNFARLGAGNIEVRCCEVGPGSDLPECDIIFADPARRSVVGKKVFRLEDCSPDIRAMLPLLLSKAPVVLLKLSPMADISLLASELGANLSLVHIVSLRSEVKELLCLLQRGHAGGFGIVATEIATGGAEASFSFSPDEEKEAQARFSPAPQAGQLLLEPRAALMKSGAYKLLCSRFSIAKLAASTHLYVCGAADPEPFRGLFKVFRIVKTRPFCGREAQAVGRLYPDAEVSARNLPQSSDALRKKIGATGGGRHHIFGCGTAAGRLLIVCESL